MPHVHCILGVYAHELLTTHPSHTHSPHPCTPCSLHDDSAVVRKNTLVVLTHLILNDMIKVKGQISAMALCLEDPEQKIADLAKLFFHELSKKVSAHTLATAKPIHMNAQHVFSLILRPPPLANLYVNCLGSWQQSWLSLCFPSFSYVAVSQCKSA